MKFVKKTSDIFMVFIFFLAALAISMAGYSKGEFELTQKISNNFLSQKAMSLSSGLQFQNYAENLLSENVLYFKGDYNVYWIYFKNKFQIPVTSGRFFTPEDFNSSIPKAIAGEGVDIQVSGDGKSYYLHNGIQYEVIGTAGIKKVSWLDNCVYLTALNGIQMDWTNIIIDGMQVSENTKILQNKFEGFTANTLEEEGIARIFKSNDTSFETVFKYIGWILFFTIVTVTCFWITQKKKLILILKICGISRFHILKTLCMEYSQYAVLSFSLGIIFSVIFIRPMFSFQFNILNNVIFIIAGIFFCIVPALVINLNWASRSMGRYQR